MTMPLSRDNKIILKANLKRRIVTFPFLVMMVVALFPLFTSGGRWIKSQFGWNKTDAKIMVISSNDVSYFRYIHEKKGTSHTGSVPRQKLLWLVPFGAEPEERGTVQIAYNPSKPSEYIVYTRIYCELLTWFIIEVLSVILYLWADTKIKEKIRKETSGRLTG